MENPYLYQPIDDEPKVKVLADADVLLECFINRGRFIEDAERLLTEIEQSQQIEVYVTDKCLKRTQLQLGGKLGEDAVLYVKKILHNRIIEISKSIREEARTCCLPDFDSAEEVVCAKTEQLNAIVTLNPKNFDGINDFMIWSVEELFARLQLNKNLLIQYEQKKTAIFMSGSFSFSTEIRREEAIEVFIGHGGVGKSYMPLVSGSTIRGILQHHLVRLGLLSSPKTREIINLSWIKQIKTDDFDNWITSNKALLLLLGKNYRTCESKISHTIYSSKDLLKLLPDKFPKKNENKYYKLPFFYSPHQLELLQNSRWIWRFKLSLTITLGRNVPNTSATCSTNICKLAP